MEPHYRTGDELRKHQNVGHECQRISQRLARSAVDIDDVAQMVEREERNPDRQHEVQDVAAVAAKGLYERVHLA